MKVYVRISGQVQGVGFRYAVRGKMNELGIVGWAENLPDGRVEAEFEGEKDRIDKMLEWCKEGPPLAQVNKVEVERK